MNELLTGRSDRAVETASVSTVVPQATFVVAFNRDRDFYQVPLALHEAGMLSSLVTDFYFPHDRPLLRRLPGLTSLRHRCTPALPSAKVHGSWAAFLSQAAAKFIRRDPLWLFDRVDCTLSLAALHHAEREGAHLFLYSGYAHHAFASDRSRGMVKGLFVFHPHAQLVRRVLAEDVARYPECRQSYASEYETAERGAGTAAREQEWAHADFIACASSFTAHSLQEAGCDATKAVAVVPYGSDVEAVPFTARAANDKTQFIFVGQGVQRKGLHHLLRAWARLQLRDAELTIVAPSIDPGIAALADASVRLLPRLPRAQMLNLLNASDVFVMPSLIEGFGLVYLEALAAGCHCIGTWNTGLPDLQRHYPKTANALSLVVAGAIDELVDAMHRAHTLVRTGAIDRRRVRDLTGAASWGGFREGIAACVRRHLARRGGPVAERPSHWVRA
jgi:glycosyltransferase involved in cell wall biosynthesis